MLQLLQRSSHGKASEATLRAGAEALCKVPLELVYPAEYEHQQVWVKADINLV